MLRFVIRNDTREGDLEVDSDGSLLDSTAAALDTVVTVSLFTDATATQEELDRYGLEQRGYWADAYDSDPGLNTGSKLWLLVGQCINAATLQIATGYCDEALAWLVKDGGARKVVNVLERVDEYTVAGTTSIYMPGAKSPYVVTWEAYFAL